jgi:cytochrome c oxidase accessory protein FixG
MIDLQQKRRIVRILTTLLYFGIPFLMIGGESALRFDIPTLRLLFFGSSIYIENFFLILLFTFFVTFLFILITQLYGRIWCGWFCPQTIITNLTSFFDKKTQSFVNKLINHILVFIVSALVGTAIVWYFVSPYQFFSELFAGTLGKVPLWSSISLTVITYLNFAFVRHKFCTTVCPYSKFQSVMFDDNTLIIAMDPETSWKCVKCQACVTTCPVGIDIRQGMNNKCVNCGQCITACTKTMAREDEDVPTLIDYIYGFDNEKKPFRTNVMITGVITLLFFAGFMFKALTIAPYEFEVFPNKAFLPRYKDERIINSYEIMLKNLTKENIVINLSIAELDEYELQAPENIVVKPNETFKKDVFLFIPAEKLKKMPILNLKMVAKADYKKGTAEESELSFRRPITRKSKRSK